MRGESSAGEGIEKQNGGSGGGNTDSEREQLDHGVWDEPGFSPELAGRVPESELTYERWLRRRRADTSAARSWMTAALVAVLAGPWAIFGALWGTGRTPFSVLGLTVFGPVTEEIMKVALVLYILETRPYLFRSRVQVIFCAVAGAAGFAVVENLLYLYVYVPDASPLLFHWRWTVCTTLHVGCSLIAGLGLARVWRGVWKRMVRPRVSGLYPYLLGAIVLHGCYNGLALLLSAAGFQF